MRKFELTDKLVDGRPGFVDENGQVFAAPKSENHKRRWLERLLVKGYLFG